ncbi:MAG: hypothetical protein EA402_11770 [Planctomycetota bacterium]|nr:MAG: hypothetical protein EA402_11770 [Planctomycetota bacterium]
MRVLVDTCIWSQVLRRSVQTPELDAALENIINESRLVIIGPIRQELLSGIKDRRQLQRLKRYLSAFPDADLTCSDYERAAECFNTNVVHLVNGLIGSAIKGKRVKIHLFAELIDRRCNRAIGVEME